MVPNGFPGAQKQPKNSPVLLPIDNSSTSMPLLLVRGLVFVVVWWVEPIAPHAAVAAWAADLKS